MDAPMPRKGLFQRKGAAPMAGGAGAPPSGKPSLVIAIGHGDPHGSLHPEGSTQDNAKDPKGGGEGMANDPVQCPNCGCTFKPETGEIVDQHSGDDQGAPMDGGPGADGTDLGVKLKAMMGGGGAGGAPPTGGQ